jgi:hypothetical protein
MRFIKKFEKFLESSATAAEPDVKPVTKPPITKPDKPTKPGKPIVRPSVDPEPKAEQGEVTEMDVARRFVDEVNQKGESVEKYLNK